MTLTVLWNVTFTPTWLCKSLFRVKSYPLLFFFALPMVSQGKVVEKIHAVVNGDLVTLTDITEYQKKLAGNGFLNDLLFADPAEREKAAADRNYLIKKIIDERIIDFNVKKNGFTATETQIDKEIDNIAKSRGITRQDLISTLRSQGISLTSYRRFIAESLSRRQLVEKEITSKIKISDEDIVSHYLSQKGETAKAAFSYQVKHILFSKEDRQKAQKIAATVNASNFDEMVAEHSTDDDSKKRGGLFGTFKSGEMAPVMETSVSALASNGVSSLVETPMGFHVFKLVKKERIPDPEMEKARPAIYQSLFGKLFKEQFDFWLSEQRKLAIIQLNPS